jgi:CheY-like chemotaxis protein
LGDGVTLDTRLGSSIESVRADRAQIELLLFTLALNARDAMPNGGALTIDTALVNPSAAIRHGRWTIPPGRYVRLIVADSGSGMTTEVMERLFEPFFTTKRRGKGTGLGLSTVYGIVSQSGGYVAAESAVGGGSRFFIYLPVSDAVPAAPAAAPLVSTVVGGGTILVAEDDPAIRAFAREVLSADGYRVLIARDGEEAEAIADGEDRGIDLLLTDVVMPGISGPALAQRLTAQRRAIKVLYMTGYTNESLGSDGLTGDQISVLQKPFTSAALLHAVRALLPAASLIEVGNESTPARTGSLGRDRV